MRRFSLALLGGILAVAPLAADDKSADKPADSVAAARLQEQTFVYTGGEYDKEPFKYRLLVPAKLEPGRKYPVVLFLHGAGERGDDNLLQLKYLPEWMAGDKARAEYPCYLIAPQCRDEQKWVDVPWDGSDTIQQPDQPSHQMQVALAILDEVLNKHPADPNRVYLTGLSMGGFGAWDLAARHPERFAAVVPICGYGDPATAPRLAGLNIWCFHGEADPVVKVSGSRKIIEAIQKAGGHPKYTELKGVGHDSWTPAYTDSTGVIPWMFKQVRR